MNDQAKYWFDVFRDKYLLFGRVPKKDCNTPDKAKAWKKFCCWIIFHDPPFPTLHRKQCISLGFWSKKRVAKWLKDIDRRSRTMEKTPL